MPPISEIKDMYLVVGIGGMSFLALVFVLYFLLKSIIPAVNGLKDIVLALKQENAINTRVLEELAKSNENVATALTLVKQSLVNVETKIADTQEGLEKVELGLEKVLESTDEILKHTIVIDTKISNKN